jgi:hypothetical protein
MKLLPAEASISTENLPHLTLTTHRVRYDQTSSGATRIVSITLDSVSSCGIVSKSFPILLILAAIAAILGAVMVSTGMGEGTLRNGTFVVALVLGIAYFLTRKVVLAISSAGESITVAAGGQKPDARIAFIDSVEQAKLAYLGKVTSQPEGYKS